MSNKKRTTIKDLEFRLKELDEKLTRQRLSSEKYLTTMIKDGDEDNNNHIQFLYNQISPVKHGDIVTVTTDDTKLIYVVKGFSYGLGGGDPTTSMKAELYQIDETTYGFKYIESVNVEELEVLDFNILRKLGHPKEITDEYYKLKAEKEVHNCLLHRTWRTLKQDTISFIKFISLPLCILVAPIGIIGLLTYFTRTM